MSAGICRALEKMDITVATEVQQKTLPVIMSGADCLVKSPTGTGKTYAYGIPMMERTDIEDTAVQSLIICPTRELADQTASALKSLSEYTEGVRVTCIFGGQQFEKQLNALRRKPQIVVGTPGRVVDMIKRKALRIKKAKLFVLDEADEMLKMGFREELDFILSKLPSEVQKTFFSATVSGEIATLSKKFQKDAIFLQAKLDGKELPEIEQYIVKVDGRKKYSALTSVLAEYKYVLIFCNTKAMVERLQDRLIKDGYNAAGLHGDMIQRHRSKVIDRFRKRETEILIASDVLARGIDIDDIEAVINYDVPMKPEFYIHRIGRTARAAKEGKAIVFATKNDYQTIKEIEKTTKVTMREIVMDGISDEKTSGNNDNATRFFVNVGQKDGANNKKLIEFFVKQTNLNYDEISNVKVLELFSFVEVAKENASAILKANGSFYGGRKVSVEKTTDKGGNKNSKAKKDVNFDDRSNKNSNNKKYSSSAKREYGSQNDYGNRKEYGRKNSSENNDHSDANREYGSQNDYGNRKEYGRKNSSKSNDHSSGRKEYDSQKDYMSKKSVKRDIYHGNKKEYRFANEEAFGGVENVYANESPKRKKSDINKKPGINGKSVKHDKFTNTKESNVRIKKDGKAYGKFENKSSKRYSRKPNNGRNI